MRLIALYRKPADPVAFDQAYFGEHLPLISRVPGLQATRITRFTRTIMGEGFHLMAEMDFADEVSLKAGMKSPEMAEAGANLATFAEGLTTLLFATESEPYPAPADL